MAAAAAALCLAALLLLSADGAAVVSRRRHRSHPTPPSPASGDDPSAASPSILLACNATRYKSLCVSSLSNCGFSSAADIAAAAIFLAGKKIPDFEQAASGILTMSVNNVNRTNAAYNCLDFLSFSSRRLAAAAAPSDGVAFSRLLVGTALLHQYDCWSAYKYVNGTAAVASAMADLSTNIMLTSNAAAMLFALERYGNDTGSWDQPATERDGYWPSSAGDSAVDPDIFGVPKNLVPNVTVCGGGDCDFDTVQAAVTAAPDNGIGWFVIKLGEGLYEETVRVGYTKTNVVFLGSGIGKTVITGNLNADTPGISTYNTATVAILGDGFMARDLTISNTAGPDRHQAVAFRSTADRTLLDSVELLGHQDTLYAHAMRQLYTRCRISGTVDFVFGNGATFIHDSDITVVPRQINPAAGERDAVTAHGRSDPSQPTGIVLSRCRINGSDEYLEYYRRKPDAHQVYLGRPWKEFSRTVYIDCAMAEIVRPEGWMPWDGSFALATLYYGELGSSGPGGSDGRRVAWSSQVPPEHAAAYSVENFIQGDRWAPRCA